MAKIFSGKQRSSFEIEEDSRLPHHPKNQRFSFHLKHSRSGWNFVVDEDAKKGVWRPILPLFPHNPGSNGVGTAPRGQKLPLLEKAKEKLRREGFKLIEHDAFPGGYVVEYEGRDGKPVYNTVFYMPVVEGDKMHWDFMDPECIAVEAGYTWQSWCDELLEKGHLWPITKKLVKDQIKLQEGVIRRLPITAKDVVLQEKYEAEKLKLELLREELKRIEKEEQEKIDNKRKAKVKTKK